MKICAIRDLVVPIRSDIRNAFIDFSQMTASIVGVQSDVIRDGKPLIGYGFNSNGRYSQSGILRDRFIPRLLNAAPDALLDGSGANIDPAKAFDIMLANEKPGGHGERSVAVGALDMALWDLAAKIEGLPLYQLLGQRYRGGDFDEDVFVYAAGGYYYPGKDIAALQAEIKTYRDLGYINVKIKIGGESLDDDRRRIEAVLDVVGAGQALAVDANGRFDLKTALAYADALAQYDLFWYEEAGRSAGFPAECRARPMQRDAAGDRRKSLLDGRRDQPHPLRRAAPRSGLSAIRSRLELRLGRVPAHAGYAGGSRLVAAALHPPRRASIRAAYRRRPGPRRE